MTDLYLHASLRPGQILVVVFSSGISIQQEHSYGECDPDRWEGQSPIPQCSCFHRARRKFFPTIILSPFRTGLHAACDSAVLFCLLAAGCSWLRGGKYVYRESENS